MSQRVRIKRHPERAVPQEAAAILGQGSVAHVGFIHEGGPIVLPFMYQYSTNTPDRLYLHGAHASRAMRHLAGGAPVCVEVTLLDGLVYSRTAESHSANYRSVVVLGRAQAVDDEMLKRAVFDDMTQRYFPDRTLGRDYQPVTSNYLLTTTLVEVIIEDWNGKARQGPPLGPLDADPSAPGTAGVVDVSSGCGPPAYPATVVGL